MTTRKKNDETLLAAISYCCRDNIYRNLSKKNNKIIIFHEPKLIDLQVLTTSFFVETSVNIHAEKYI